MEKQHKGLLYVNVLVKVEIVKSFKYLLCGGFSQAEWRRRNDYFLSGNCDFVENQLYKPRWRLMFAHSCATFGLRLRSSLPGPDVSHVMVSGPHLANATLAVTHHTPKVLFKVLLV